MQKILIDKFVVPEESLDAFLAEVRKSASFLKTIPGFIEGFIYERTDGGTPCNVVTTAVWNSEEAFENAKKIAKSEFEKRGFNPQEIMARLRVEMERGVYERSPY